MTEREGAVRPSKLAVTKMLAEAETTRRRAVKYSLLALLLPLLIGAGLLAYTFRAVSQKLREKREIEADVQKLRDEKAELESQTANLALTLGKIKSDVKAAAEKGEPAKALEETINDAIKSNPTIAQATPRVFIHINSDAQVAWAARVSGAVEKLGYVVPRVERVTSAPQNAEVRYYLPADQDAANKVSDLLRGEGLSNIRVRKFEGTVRAGTLEVWFPLATGQDVPTPAPTRPDLKDKVKDKVEDKVEAGNNRRDSNDAGRGANRPPRRERP